MVANDIRLLLGSKPEVRITSFILELKRMGVSMLEPSFHYTKWTFVLFYVYPPTKHDTLYNSNIRLSR